MTCPNLSNYAFGLDGYFLAEFFQMLTCILTPQSHVHYKIHEFCIRGSQGLLPCNGNFHDFTINLTAVSKGWVKQTFRGK